MSKEVILGIDFSRDNAQIAYLDTNSNPQSISMGTADNYMIPSVVCYNSDIKEWSAGDEAVNKSKLENSTIYNDLIDIVNREMSEEDIKVMSTFFSYLIKVSVNFLNGRLIKNILVTVEELNPTISSGILKVFGTLGYGKDDIKVISHSESFVYYVLNQNKDIWINNVCFLDLDKHRFESKRLDVIKGRELHVADVSTKDISELISLDMVKNEPEKADTILANYLDELMKNKIFSGVFLSGEGFFEYDFPKTLNVICRNRRVFKGNNLIVKGATYGAREFFLPPTLSRYLISCKGRTRVKITMGVNKKGIDTNIVLSNIGDYWYESQSKAECIMEQPTEAVFEIQDLINHSNERFKISLKDFPQRDANTTRLEVCFKYVEEDRFLITITDLGFGEFFEPSGMVASREIRIGETL